MQSKFGPFLIDPLVCPKCSLLLRDASYQISIHFYTRLKIREKRRVHVTRGPGGPWSPGVPTNPGKPALP